MIFTFLPDVVQPQTSSLHCAEPTESGELTVTHTGCRVPCLKHTMINPPFRQRPHQTLWWVPVPREGWHVSSVLREIWDATNLQTVGYAQKGLWTCLDLVWKRKGRFLSKGRKSSGQFFWRIEPIIAGIFHSNSEHLCFWSSEWCIILKVNSRITPGYHFVASRACDCDQISRQCPCPPQPHTHKADTHGIQD